MRFPFAFLGLSTQIPLQPNPPSHSSSMATQNADFAYKEAPDIFSPKDLVSPGVVYDSSLDLNTIHRSNLGGQVQQLPMLREILHLYHTASTHSKTRSEKPIEPPVSTLNALSFRNQKFVFVVSLGGDGKAARIPVSFCPIHFFLVQSLTFLAVGERRRVLLAYPEHPCTGRRRRLRLRHLRVSDYTFLPN